MALTQELQAAFNDQITLELESAHQYLALSAWLEREGLPGMAHWMRLQSGEESEHAMKFYRFLADRGATVELGAIAKPKSEFDSVVDVFRASLAAEQRVTAAIHNIYSMATDARDFASFPLLDWFVDEQVEEESTVQQIIDDLERTQGNGHALLMLDRELGARQEDDES
ncbi:MAG: ferritin [Acidimicrobiia bacterium]|nr:ferritin [Acidimicrobiia bacterium]